VSCIGIFDSNQVSSVELAVRLQGFQKSMVFECNTVRFHLTADCLGVGLRYTELAGQKTDDSKHQAGISRREELVSNKVLFVKRND